MCPNPASLKSPVAPLGRKRTRNHDLPPRMARKGAHYYYVCNKPRRWIPLGIDLAAAKRKWAELEQGPAQGLTVGELVQRYIDTHGHELAAGTVKQYRSFHRAIVLSFPIPANQLTPVHVALWRDLPDQRRRRTYVNGCLAVLRAACAMGAEQGLSSDLRVRGNRLKPRDRYLTDDEYRAIREKAPEWLQIAMDLGYLTAARRSDVLAFTWADVDSTLSMRQMKTKQRMSFEITPELSAILGEARKRRVLGLHIVANSRGGPFTLLCLGGLG